MANFGRPEPRFDIDFSYGNVGERLRETHYAWIMDGSGKVEVKRNRYLDLHLYVEQSCNKGRGGCYEPSGINVTEAEVWDYVIADTGICLSIPTRTLRRAMNGLGAQAAEEEDGDNPTRGKLVALQTILEHA